MDAPNTHKHTNTQTHIHTYTCGVDGVDAIGTMVHTTGASPTVRGDMDNNNNNDNDNDDDSDNDSDTIQRGGTECRIPYHRLRTDGDADHNKLHLHPKHVYVSPSWPLLLQMCTLGGEQQKWVVYVLYRCHRDDDCCQRRQVPWGGVVYTSSMLATNAAFVCIVVTIAITTAQLRWRHAAT